MEEFIELFIELPIPPRRFKGLPVVREDRMLDPREELNPKVKLSGDPNDELSSLRNVPKSLWEMEGTVACRVRENPSLKSFLPERVVSVGV